MGKGTREVSDTTMGLGAVALMALCCGGPALVATGALAAIARFFTNPIVAGVAVIAVTLATVAVLRRRSADSSCCTPELPSSAPRGVRSGWRS